MDTLWSLRECAPGHCLGGAVGRLRLWILRNPLDWSVTSQSLPSARIEPLRPTDPPAGAAWQRFAAPADSLRVRLVPVLPERPLVMRPGAPIQILPGHTASLFVTLPVGLRIEAAGTRPAVLCELPTQPLSKSWLGENTAEGEICFALHTRARQSLDELTDTHQGRAVCPVTLQNHSDALLPFIRLCLRTRHMAVYGTPDGRLWTNLTTVVHKGGAMPDQVAFADGPPVQAIQPFLLCPPREAVAHVFAKRALGGLFSFPALFS
jgi:hypothetical protein